MKTWKKVSWMAPVLLAGCILPLDIDVDGDHGWSGHDADAIRGSGRVVTETRNVVGFDAIRVSGAARVIVERTGHEALRITAEDNLMAYVSSVIEGRTLVLGPRPGVSLSPTEDIVFHLEVVELRRIEGSGAVSFQADLGTQPDLEVILSGVCVADVDGTVESLDVTLSGVTGYQGLHLESRRARVMASGVSWAHVWATERLEAWASGVSAILYIGAPQLEAHTSGTSTVGRY